MGIVFLLILGVLGIEAASWASPWMAWPDLHGEALDREWAELQARTATHPMCQADPSALDEALASHEPVQDDVAEILYDHDERIVPVRAFPAAAQRSGELLVDWAASDGGVGAVGVNDSGRTMDLFRLGQAAASSDDPARVHAALRLAEGLRHCGPLVSGAVGMAITDAAQGLHPDVVDAHPDLRPSADDLLAILHAEAVTGDIMIELLDDPSLGSGWEGWLLDPERERAMLRAMWVQRLAGLPADTAAIRAAFPRQEPEEMPHSLVLRLMLVGVATVVDDLATSIDAAP